MKYSFNILHTGAGLLTTRLPWQRHIFMNRFDFVNHILGQVSYFRWVQNTPWSSRIHIFHCRSIIVVYLLQSQEQSFDSRWRGPSKVVQQACWYGILCVIR